MKTFKKLLKILEERKENATLFIKSNGSIKVWTGPQESVTDMLDYGTEYPTDEPNLECFLKHYEQITTRDQALQTIKTLKQKFGIA